jgi:hypothetical protein
VEDLGSSLEQLVKVAPAFTILLTVVQCSGQFEFYPKQPWAKMCNKAHEEINVCLAFFWQEVILARIIHESRLP